IGLAHLSSVPVALLPAWLGWRWAFSRPRQLNITCPNCQWRGASRITEEVPPSVSKGSVVVYGESEIEGIPNPKSPTKSKLERLEQRKRRRARQARAEAQDEPNPDFDFGQPR